MISLSFLSLFFWNSLFFPLRGIPCFLSVFPFFSRDFRGSAGIKNPCFFGEFPGNCPKNKERKDRVFMENPRGGGVSRVGGGEGPGGCLRGMWGVELNIFFRGRNSHQVF